MRVILKYCVNELEAVIDMVLNFNKAAVSNGWSRDYVRASLFESMEAFKDASIDTVSTMGYTISAIDDGEFEHGAKVLSLRFSFAASVYGNTNSMRGHVGSYDIGEEKPERAIDQEMVALFYAMQEAFGED